MTRDYRKMHVGMAVDSGAIEAKKDLIELLEKAAELSGNLHLYVGGEPLDRVLWGVMGGLQRSSDQEGESQ